MNILITGSTGFIGKSLSQYLSKNNHVVIAPTRQELDLSSKDSTEKFIETHTGTIDAIIHLASKLCNINQSEKAQLEDFKDNILISEHIVLIAQKFKPKNFLNISSMAVYPNIDGEFLETSEIRPSQNSEGIYGLAKFCAENIIDLYLKKYNISISHLRLCQVYGKDMRSDRIISILKEELKNNNTVSVFGKGERISCFIDIDKLLKIFDFFLSNSYTGIFNIGDQNMTYYQLAEHIIKEEGSIHSKIVKIPSGSRAKFILNFDKFKSLGLF